MKKEKNTEEIRVAIPLSLRDSFKETCGNDYKTMSEVVRSLIFNYVKEEAKDV